MRIKDGSQSLDPADPADLVGPCHPGAAIGQASDEMDDSTLLRRIRAGDQRALEVLGRRAWKPVYRSFARFTRDPAEAEDLTQEVFLRALRSLPQFEDRGLPFTTYLLRIASNLARDRWRAGLSFRRGSRRGAALSAGAAARPTGYPAQRRNERGSVRVPASRADRAPARGQP